LRQVLRFGTRSDDCVLPLGLSCFEASLRANCGKEEGRKENFLWT
jgi:hypothetical protein